MWTRRLCNITNYSGMILLGSVRILVLIINYNHKVSAIPHGMSLSCDRVTNIYIITDNNVREIIPELKKDI